MKFLALREFDDVSGALNFDTPDCHVIGACDLYTTKAAGSDKKLYKNIEGSLESQYESLLRFSASLSPPQTSEIASSMNLSRSSPFGPLSQISSRRTFAYLIATLNASHPDYDFSNILRPGDFRRERSLKSVINVIDTTLLTLRPSLSTSIHAPSQTSYSVPASATPVSQAWGPQMWMIIDKEMTLKECLVYKYSEDPLDGEDGAIWTHNYLFFNKTRKRVCYLHVRGVPVVTYSPRTGLPKRSAGGGLDLGANKRARYWLGDRADALGMEDEDSAVPELWNLNEDDLPDNDDEFCDSYDDEADDESEDLSYKPKTSSSVRGMSEEFAGRMDLD